MLMSLVLAVPAAVLAWLANCLLGGLPLKKKVIVASFVEEALKTLPAAFFSASIFLTHLFFGAAEGIWEILAGRRNGFYAGLSALASHSLFGCITLFACDFYGVVPALAAGYLAHALWNYAVLEYLPARRDGRR
ncbi:MAG: hypothetical protein HPY89_09780 [Pelotomaculum sp.]|uniref:Hypothetical membrane protein n=1 Tax=Pelotomaculum thermopropionicum (strain DSM 13744 / JCM 10971 / SI) TaxID=370438 RepID=A5D634_PELTS|nr:hypothetical protein [Pelotomaculum sp.]BAF58295.1 hypothetical membrane protein [Pelotomaculum thermopropionicum SI]